MGNKVRIAILLILFVIALIGVVSFYPLKNTSQISFSNNKVDIADINSAKLLEGQLIEMTLNQQLTLEVNTKILTLTLEELNGDNKTLRIKLEGEVISMSSGEKITKDYNQNGANNLVIIVDAISSTKARFYLKENFITKNNVSEIVNPSFTNIYNYILFSIFLLLLILLIWYTICFYGIVYPSRKNMERKNSILEFKNLVEEFEKNKNIKHLARRTFTKIKKLYHKLPDNEKIRIRSKIREFERYLNKTD